MASLRRRRPEIIQLTRRCCTMKEKDWKDRFGPYSMLNSTLANLVFAPATFYYYSPLNSTVWNHINGSITMRGSIYALRTIYTISIWSERLKLVAGAELYFGFFVTLFTQNGPSISSFLFLLFL